MMKSMIINPKRGEIWLINLDPSNDIGVRLVFDTAIQHAFALSNLQIPKNI
jgi:hypothetical protein